MEATITSNDDVLAQAEAALGELERVRSKALEERRALAARIAKLDEFLASLPVQKKPEAATEPVTQAPLGTPAQANERRQPKPKFDANGVSWPDLIVHALDAVGHPMTSGEITEAVGKLRSADDLAGILHSTLYRMVNAESPRIGARGDRGAKRFYLKKGGVR